MKVTVNLDATPQELRTLMGLPDIEPLQAEVMEKLREKLMQGMDANTPMDLLQLMMQKPDSFKSMEAMQDWFWKAFSPANWPTGASDKGDKSGD